jgi:hypothetical protein
MQTSYNVEYDRAIVRNAKQVRICRKTGAPVSKHYCSIRLGRLKTATCNHLRKKPFLAALLSSARRPLAGKYKPPTQRNTTMEAYGMYFFFSAKEVTSLLQG